MRPLVRRVVAGVVWLGVASAGAGSAAEPSAEWGEPQAGPPPAPEYEPIAVIPADRPLDRARASLGEALFGDPILAEHSDVACISCHALERGGADGLPRAALRGAEAPLNTPTVFNVTPTVFNVVLNYLHGWDGKTNSLRRMLDAHLTDPAIMGLRWENLAARLAASRDYAEAFAPLYPEGSGRDAVLDVLIAYMEALVTPDCRFDRYLRGTPGAINAEEERGYRLFKAYGCASCHQGVNVGGNLLARPVLFDDANDGTQADDPTARFLADDTPLMRVPPLRNVASTAPYFSDGSSSSLAEAVRLMAYRQLGIRMPPADVEAIVRFLGSLDGEPRGTGERAGERAGGRAR